MLLSHCITIEPGNGVNRYHNVSVVSFSPMYLFDKSERIMIPSSTVILNNFVAKEKKACEIVNKKPTDSSLI